MRRSGTSTAQAISWYAFITRCLAGGRQAPCAARGMQPRLLILGVFDRSTLSDEHTADIGLSYGGAREGLVVMELRKQSHCLALARWGAACVARSGTRIVGVK